mmetsp:Transcript_98983/g.171531  ORF Transcript_98983/g.171531 Transcript_98983/m.171531 type:complete len:359 (+) Transcript_98983:82-1158(+)
MLALTTLHHTLKNATLIYVSHGGAEPSPTHGGVLSGPVALSALLTLTVIGPDHLATLVALCASKRGWEAFNIGTVWGIGHTVGIMAIVPILMIFQAYHGVGATQEMWEHFGNYVIGVMMVCCGMYFVIFQSKYFVKQEDGTLNVQACTCCQQSDIFKVSKEQEEGQAANDSASSWLIGDCDPQCVPCEHEDPYFLRPGKKLSLCSAAFSKRSVKTESSLETTPLITARDEKSDAEKASPAGTHAVFWSRFFGNRGLESIVIGLLQGFCCPSGLQSMIILTHISRSFSATMTFLFGLAFYVGSAVGSGLVTFFIAEFAQLGLGAMISPKAVYIGSCAFTICLGITWILLNATGSLENLG